MGAGARPMALAECRPDSICLLPASRGSCFESKSSTARHRRHHVGQLPIHFVKRARAEPSRDAGPRLHGDPRAMPVRDAAETGSHQDRFQCLRHDGECNRGVILRLSHFAESARRGNAAAAGYHCSDFFCGEHGSGRDGHLAYRRQAGAHVTTPRRIPPPTAPAR